MISLHLMFLFLLILSKAEDYYLTVSDGYPDDNIQFQPNKNHSNKYPYYFVFVGKCDNYDDLIQRCQNHQVNYPFCDFVLNAVGTHCHDNNTQDYDFQDVPGEVEKIFMAIRIKRFYPLFNLLQHKTIVHITNSYTADPEIYFQNYNITRDSEYKDKGYVFIPRDSGRYVSYLFVEDHYVSATKVNEIDIETVYFKNCVLEDEVVSKYATSEGTDIKFPSNHIFKQYTVVLPPLTNRTQYRLSYWAKSLAVEYKDYDEENYNEYEYFTFIPYTNAEMYGFTFVGHYVDLNINENNLYNSFHPINISMMDFDPFSNCYLEEPTNSNIDKKYYVQITTSGNWSEVEDIKNVYFNAYQEYIDLKTDLNSLINFSKVDAYYHKPLAWIPNNYQPLNTVDKSTSYYIFVVNKNERDTCKKMIEEKLKCRWNDECPDKNEKLDYIIDAKCATNESINDVLRFINEGIDKIYIENTIDNVYIDLTKLQYQVVVKISSTYLENLDFFKPYYSTFIAKKVMLNCDDINSKVSYLTITNSNLNIRYGLLDMYSLKLLYSNLVNYTGISTHDLIVDATTYVHLFESKVYIHAKQYCLMSPFDDDDINYKIRIAYDRWVVSYNNDIDSDYYIRIINDLGYNSYDFSETACFIAHSHNFYFVQDDNAIINNFNLTIVNDTGIDMRAINYVQDGENEYNISLTNDFTKLNITVTAYYDIINLNYNSTYFNVINDEAYHFNPHPLIKPDDNTNSTNSTIIPVKTPTPEIFDELYEKEYNKEITDLYSFNSDLEKSFQKLNDEEIEGNQIVIVNAKSFPYSKKLNDNQYIKPLPYSEINFIDGDLNMIIPEEGKVDVNLNNNQNGNLLLKGNGKVTLNTAKNEININIKARINGSLSISIPNAIESLTLDSIDLSNEGDVKCLSFQNIISPMSVNKINADSTTKTILNLVTVKDKLTIDQMAEVQFYEVNVENANITYNLYNYNQLKPILKGEFGNPPKNFDINLISKPDSIDKFNVISGDFDDKICEKWANKINLNIDKYRPTCVDVNSRSLENSQKLLYIDFNAYKDPTSDDDDDNNNNNNNNKNGLSGGAIAGIVIAVIAVIAIIVVAVIFIMKKKRNDKSSGSVNEGNDDANEEV